MARAAPAATLLQAHGRSVQSSHLQLALSQLGTLAGRAAQQPSAATCAPLAAALPAADPGLWKRRYRRQDASRCLAVQQLHADAAGAVAAGAAAAAASAGKHSIRPGEVHLWWLDPRKVGEGCCCRTGDGRDSYRDTLQPALPAPVVTTSSPPTRRLPSRAGPCLPAPSPLTCRLQVRDEAALARCRELLTPEELADCEAAGDAGVQRARVLARALVRCVRTVATDASGWLKLTEACMLGVQLLTADSRASPARTLTCRSVLAGYLPGAPHPRSLAFDRNPHGKPRLLGPAVATPAGHELRFNLTHTPSMIGLAITGAP